MSVEMTIVIPTRGRPENLKRVIQAWYETGAFGHADMLVAIDADDPRYPEYLDLIIKQDADAIDFLTFQTWWPMVTKLNVAARYAAESHRVVGFAGDDHVPRTDGWANSYLATLRRSMTGIVYGNDLHRGIHLPTQWAMTSDIITGLGRMVPARVHHLFCDRSILDLGRATQCIVYLPTVVIEHMHYRAGKAEKDIGYQSVNNRNNQEQDKARYLQWYETELPGQIQMVRELIGGQADSGDSSPPETGALRARPG